MTETSVTPPPMPESSPPSPLPVMSYATREPSNQAAVLSIVFGLLVLVPLAVPGLLAVLFGRRGLKAAGEEAAGREGLARIGIVLAWAFCDGHVEFVGGALASRIAAQLAAGQNPPPSKP